MRIAELLELDSIEPVEPFFSDLIYLEMDEVFLANNAKSGRILVDEDENPAAFAIETDNTWKGCFTAYRQPSTAILDLFEQLDLDIYQEDRELIEDCIREYYSNKLLQTTPPGADDLNPTRAQSIKDLIKQTLGPVSRMHSLDCCCGTGVGSLIMEDLGLIPLAYDNDESLLSRGLSSKRLKPERTIWIDGRELGNYITRPYEFACGLMFGEIYSFNSDIWYDITTSICEAAERILITTGKKEEIKLIEDWISDSGKSPEVFESDADPIYDRWICYAK